MPTRPRNLTTPWRRAASAALLLLSTATPLAGQTVAIRAGGIVDPGTGTTSGPATIIVIGERITAVGRDVAVPSGAQIIDLSHAIITPGLIDTHTHLAAAYEPGATRLREYTISVSTAERALQGIANAWQMLEAGFTTVRDLGNAGNHADAALALFFGDGDRRRAAIYGGASLANTRLFGRRVVGPTIVYSGK
ncbi:MAG: amidohydrolase family protein, partial [Gemmatimonadales bacterium]